MRSTLRMQNACGPLSACKTHAVHSPRAKRMRSMPLHAKRMRFILRMQNACSPFSACKTHASHALLLNDRSEKLSEVPQTVLELLETSQMCFRSVTHDLVCKINAINPPHAKRMRSILRVQNACGPCLCKQNACGPLSACKTHAVHAPHAKRMQSMSPHAKRMRYILRMQNSCGPFSACKTHAVHDSACKTHAVHS